MSQFVSISLGSHMYRMEIMMKREDIHIGMGKYSSPPPYGMIFILKGAYKTVTMRDVSFPLYISFYDRNWNPIPMNAYDPTIWTRMYPNEQSRPMPLGAYYMLELPSGLIQPQNI